MMPRRHRWTNAITQWRHPMLEQRYTHSSMKCQWRRAVSRHQARYLVYKCATARFVLPKGIYVSTLVSSCIQDVYAMSSLPRGYAVVITMTKGRPGADVDENNIADLFQQLSFDVRKLRDKTKNVNVLLYSCLTWAWSVAVRKIAKFCSKWSPT